MNIQKTIPGRFTTKRTIWDEPETAAAIELAYEGFTHRTIASYTRLNVGQVDYRLKKHGISTADVRRGDDPRSRERLAEVIERHGLRMGRRRVVA